MPGATVTASVREGLKSIDSSPPVTTVSLFDDGTGADRIVGDGVYSGVLPGGLAAGQYVVLVQADGSSPSGARFRRDASAEMRVTEHSSRIVGVGGGAGIDGDGNGRFDLLRIAIQVQIESLGQYNLSVILRAGNGRTVGANKLGGLSPGNLTIMVDFPADHVLSLLSDAPYAVALVRLDQITESERQLRDKLVEGGAITGVRLSDFDGFEDFSRLVADAGPDQIVNENAAVTLDGTTSVGAAPTFAWQQVSGPAVTLSSETSATPTFVAPNLPGGFGRVTLMFRLTLSSGGATGTDVVNVTVQNVNHQPVAHAGGPISVNEQTPVSLNASASYDPDGDPVWTFSWQRIGGVSVSLTGAETAMAAFTAPLLPGGFGSETLTFRLTVSDGVLLSSDEVVVRVQQVNHPPSANAGPDQMRDEGSLVTLEGTLSSDADGDAIVTYSWSQIEGPPVILSNANTATPSFTAPEVGPGGGKLVFRLTVTDGALPSVADEDLSDVDIQVRNVNDAPSCAAAHADPSELWPPNHKLIPVAIVGVSDINGDSLAIAITGVTQDEAVNGSGDGNTSPDAVIGRGSTLIRSERQGQGHGRVYRVLFTATDPHNASCSAGVTVIVPINKGEPALDDGQRYDSTRP